jgi:glycosyltransferase 2 family protein
LSWKRWLITALSFAVAIGVSVYLVYRSWAEQGTMAALPLSGHLLALLVVALEILARVVKLQLSAAALDIPFTFMVSLRTILGGDFAAGITPSRSGSEPARFLVLSESGMPAASAVLLLFMELLLEVVSIAVIAILLATVFAGSGPIIGGVLVVAAGYAAFVFGVAAVGLTLARRRSRGPTPGWARMIGFNAGRWRTVQRGLRQFRHGATAVRAAHNGVLSAALAFSILHVALRLAILPVILFAFNTEVELAPILLWPLALFYGGGAAPAPGGGGLIEVGFKAALDSVIPAALFGASLIWWRFYSFYIYVLLGAVAAGRTVMRALQEGDRGNNNAEG